MRLSHRIPAAMITAARMFIPLKRIFVCKAAVGRLKDPPKERIRAVIATDRNTVAGLGEKRISIAKKIEATSPLIRITITGNAIGSGPRRVPAPSSGMRYSSPKAFVAAK